MRLFAAVCSALSRNSRGVGGVSRLDAEVLQVREQDVDLSHSFVYTSLAPHLKQIEAH